MSKVRGDAADRAIMAGVSKDAQAKAHELNRVEPAAHYAWMDDKPDTDRTFGLTKQSDDYQRLAYTCWKAYEPEAWERQWSDPLEKWSVSEGWRMFCRKFIEFGGRDREPAGVIARVMAWSMEPTTLSPYSRPTHKAAFTYGVKMARQTFESMLEAGAEPLPSKWPGSKRKRGRPRKDQSED